LPRIKSIAEAVAASAALLAAIAGDDLTPFSDAADIAKSVDRHLRSIEATSRED
jgi:hypothetical protein